MFWREVFVGELLDGCFRVGHVLERTSLFRSRRGKSDEVHRPQQEPFRSIQLDHRGLKEAFTPGATNGELFVKRLPAHPHLRYRCIRIIIQPLLIADSGRELQRVEPGNVKLGAENWKERFRINRPLFAPSFNRLDPADTSVLLKAVLVIRIDSISFPAKHATEGESNAACGQIKQVGGINI